MSDTVTHGIRVQVEGFYDPAQSSPRDSHYFFAYQVKISNEGGATVQLRSRRWVITDANGDVQTVEGPGVVGEQPVLAAGDSFEYRSFCPLSTPFGTMHGAYHMLLESGETFDAEIAPFSLAVPHVVS
jgi:ApaG protein